MNRRRRRAIAFGLVVALPLVVLAAACSFPEVSFGPTGGTEGGSPDSPVTNPDAPVTNPDAPSNPDAPNAVDGGFDADADAGADADAADPNPLFDGGMVDAETRTDAEAPVMDASVCAERPLCDCDLDNHRDEECVLQAQDAGDASVDANLQGNDCDDRDPVRNPGEQFRGDEPPAGSTHNGDWNCNQLVERAPPINLKCAPPTMFYSGIFPLGHDAWKCNGGGVGFLGQPACGKKADTYRCPTTAEVLNPAECDPSTDTVGVTANCK